MPGSPLEVLDLGGHSYWLHALIENTRFSIRARVLFPTSRILFLTSRNSSFALHLARGVRLKHGVSFRLPCEVPSRAFQMGRGRLDTARAWRIPRPGGDSATQGEIPGQSTALRPSPPTGSAAGRIFLGRARGPFAPQPETTSATPLPPRSSRHRAREKKCANPRAPKPVLLGR